MTDGYAAYSYLTAGQDFRSFELAPEFGRVPPYAAGLTAEQQQRAETLLRESLVISLHDHPVRFPLRMEETPEYNRTGRQHAAYAGLAASGLTVVFDNMMDGTACVTGNAPWRWNDIITDLGMRQADLAHQDQVMVVRTVADIDEAYRSGRVGLVFGLEAATPIENELDRLDVLYGLGLRQIGIAYSDANALGAGLAERGDAGLTAFGRRAVTRMNKLGLAIDLSHAGDRTALDTCEQSERPVFITHAGARAVWDIPRMKPDDVLRAVAETGGVIGMSAAPHTTLSAAHPRHSIESVMDHFRYCADLVGLDHVAFGPDTLYGDHVALHRIFAHLLSMSAARGPAFDPVAYVDGLENPTENFANICGWLVQHGYDDADIRAVLGGNIYRTLQSIWVLPRRGTSCPKRRRAPPGRERAAPGERWSSVRCTTWRPCSTSGCRRIRGRHRGPAGRGEARCRTWSTGRPPAAGAGRAARVPVVPPVPGRNWPGAVQVPFPGTSRPARHLPY
jgi:membrane dipeptidase